MNEEIIGGIKNALERGISLDKAAQSFINAGYNPKEVQEAVQVLGGVSAQITTIPLATPQPILSKSFSPIQQNSVASGIVFPSTLPEQKSKTWRYVLIGLAIVIVILIAALIGVIAFSDQLLEWLKPTTG